ncbi:MAG: hypothetical protein WD029_05630, partial [Microthrixaceae bacterium]
LTFDPVNLHAWIDSLTPEPGPAQELCERHAVHLTVPQGWTYEDRRTPFIAEDPPESEPEPEPLAEQAPESEPEVVLEPAQVPKPKTRAQSKDRSQSKARTQSKNRTQPERSKPSLLSRALRSSGAQRSALSAELGATTSAQTGSSDSADAESSD